MITYKGHVIGKNGGWIKPYVDPYNPLNLPPLTIRLKYSQGVTPTFSKGTGVLVNADANIWDLTYENSDWSQLLMSHDYLLEVLGANTTGVTKMIQMFEDCYRLTAISLFDTSNVEAMDYMFVGCSSLTSVPLFDTSNVSSMFNMLGECSSLTTVPLFDTSNVTNIGDMFKYCSSLTSVPLFDTSNVSSMQNMFYACTSLTSIPLFDTSNVTFIYDMCNNCINVQSGALALYQQVSTQAHVPVNHNRTFRNCGINTESGSAELAQIPDDWK